MKLVVSLLICESVLLKRKQTLSFVNNVFCLLILIKKVFLKVRSEPERNLELGKVVRNG